MRLNNKVAFITGGGAGIGRACAKLFAQEGAKVVVAEYDAEKGAAAAEEIRAAGGEALFVQTDVSEPESMKNAVDAAVEAYGTINVLYNNVGGSTPNDGPVHENSFDEFWKKMKVDVFGTWLGCHYVTPLMIAAGGGSIINATSMVALIGMPRMHAYTAAKGAIAALTRSLAVELAPNNIRVNSIAPAGTATERVLGRLGGDLTKSRLANKHLLGFSQPEDVAYAVLYLASDEARTTTGHTMVVDSGLTIS